MAKKKKKELNYKELTPDELTREVDKKRKELFSLRFRIATAPIKNTMEVRVLRRTIARLETYLNQRRQAV